MADVAAFSNWSTTASSNKPAGTDVVGTGLADNFREIQAQVKTNLAHYNSTPVASASTVDLGAQTGLFLLISGTTTITAFGTVSAGIWKVLTFQGALTLTHNATSLILPGGANITTAAGDSAIVVSLGSGNWRCVCYMPADGKPITSTFTDSEFRISGSSDATKLVAFEVDGLTTGTTRTVTIPDADSTLLTSGTQTFSGTKTLTSPVLNTSISGTAIAGQSTMEAASSTATIVTPGNMKYHPGVAKAAAYITYSGGTPSAAASFGIDSISDDGTGLVTFTFSTAFSNANYYVAGSAATAGAFVSVATRSTTQLQVQVSDENSGIIENADRNFSIVVFGDQ